MNTHIQLLNRNIGFWVDAKVLRLCGDDRFEVIETLTQDSNALHGDMEPIMEEEAEEVREALDNAEAYPVYEKMALGLLTVMGGQPLDKIQSRLKMAMPDHDDTKAELLRRCLAKMVADGKIDLMDNQIYKLRA